jgi:uncharacterized SAM-binding protein YcdF (DUF218 family)
VSGAGVQTPAAVEPAKRWFAKWLLLLLCLTSLVYVGFLAAGAWLASPAQPPTPADAVVVLGGDGGLRYATARTLLLDGYSQRMLLIHPIDSAQKDALERLRGVQVHINNEPRSTWQEAQAVRTWMLANGLKSVLVVSDPPHLLRVHYAWASNFWGSGLAYTLIASSPPWWSARQWWQNPQAKDFVTSELLKLGYYLVRYGFGLWG